jgi:adenylate cyclase
VDILSRIAGWLGENEATISAVVGIAVLAGIVFAGLRSLLRRRGEATQGRAAGAAVEPASADSSPSDLDPLAVPGFEGRPAIAVLPFDNLSGDPEQEYFADGIAEDLITRLSAWRDFPVIARNSSFTYKGKPVDVKQVGKELGARYVVEGSVRRSEGRVRVAAQLIDATTGAHVWAETYDRELRDIFTLQDEITEAIVASMHPELWKSEQERAVRSTPQNLSAWDAAQRGWWHMRRSTKDDNAEARSLFEKATEIDPQFAQAFAGLAFTHMFDIDHQWSNAAEQSNAELYRAARHAVELDNEDAVAQLALGAALMRRGEQEEAISAFKFATQLNPGMVDAYRLLGGYLAQAGKPEEAIANLEKAMRLSPHDPWTFESLAGMAMAHVAAGRYEDAVDWAKRLRRHKPEYPISFLILAGSYVRLERIDEARSALREALRLNPAYSVSGVRLALVGADATLRERIIDALRKAGLPE